MGTETSVRGYGLNSNTLKFIAIIAMTIDHLTWVLASDYLMNPGIILLHMIGRITAPIMCYFVAEGYYHTHDLKKYITRMFIFAIISHFAYNFAFGIPFVPFKTGVLNQTGVIWALAWGLVALAAAESDKLKQWQKTTALILCCVVAFCADWSSIAVLWVFYFGTNRGNLKKQATKMMMVISVYALVFIIFVNEVYGLLQLSVALAIPLISMYNGERGSWKGMKWFFYAYYPLHLIIVGLIRIALTH
ncbi:MAG: TraX family protein [Candidatus Metalachnospira sp.]|nr:TraX family protein [Candidatus Metalachnospira sp.]